MRRIVQLDPAFITNPCDLLRFRKRKKTLDRCGLLAFLDELARNTFAGQSPEAVDDDRFPGSGFARQQVEPPTELNLDRIDQGDVFDLQKREHRFVNSESSIVNSKISAVEIINRNRYHKPTASV